MTILITTIPDDPKEWASWLEKQLVGLSLRDVIDELRLIPGTTSTPLKSLLNEEQLSEVRQHGLSSLSPNQIRALFGSPESLLELQEDVLIYGGEYWTSTPASKDIQLAVERVKERIIESLFTSDQSIPSIPVTTARRRRFGLVAAISTAAAALLIGLFAWQMQPRGSGSILGQPGLLANDVNSSTQYLTRIADAGNEWFNLHPQDSAELISLLQDVSNDCQILIDAEHQPLTAKEREWFVTKCTNWKKEFDTALASLRSGQLTFEAAEAEADKTMKKLVNVLKAGPTA